MVEPSEEPSDEYQMVSTTFRVNGKKLAALTAYAEIKGTTMAKLMRAAVDLALAQAAREIPELERQIDEDHALRRAALRKVRDVT